jgi:hypothetical protein
MLGRKLMKGMESEGLEMREANFVDCLLHDGYDGDDSGNGGGRARETSAIRCGGCCSDRKDGFILSGTLTNVSKPPPSLVGRTPVHIPGLVAPSSSPGRVLGVSPPLPTQLGAEGFAAQNLANFFEHDLYFFVGY